MATATRFLKKAIPPRRPLGERRLLVLMVFFALAIGSVVVRLFILQVPSHEFYKTLAEKQQGLIAQFDPTRGSIYLRDYSGNPEGFKRAISVCTTETQGIMLFDLVYVRDYNWWDLLKSAFPMPAQAPHTVPGLIDLGSIFGEYKSGS